MSTVTLTQAQLDEMLAKAVQAGKAQARGRAKLDGWNEALDSATESGRSNKGRIEQASFNAKTGKLTLVFAVGTHEHKSESGQSYLLSMGTGKAPVSVDVDGFGKVSTRGIYLLAD